MNQTQASRIIKIPALVEGLTGLFDGLEATVVLVSQQILPALAVCDRIAVLLDGMIVRTGTPAEIAADRAFLRSAGLDSWSSLDAVHNRASAAARNEKVWVIR